MKASDAQTCLAAVAVTVAVLAGCGEDDPGTSVQIAVAYDDSLGLDTVDVTLIDQTESTRIAHQLLLLVPDDLVGVNMPIELWGRKAGKRAAYGAGSATPVLGEIVEASISLTACSPGCDGDVLTTCTGPAVTCTLGCTDDEDARCVGPTPSNGVDPAAAEPLGGTTTITAATTFDVDSGAITGGITRPAGTGIEGGIGYLQAPAAGPGGAPLGVFVFHNLTVEAAATVRFRGTRAVVLLVGDAAKIAGTLDVAAGIDGRSTPGPGGGAGGGASPAQGCGAGAPGKKGGLAPEMVEDSGGAGGGGGAPGGAGGAAPMTPGGLAGVACMPQTLEPLQGGSGGGAGSPGMTGIFAAGGGGGGALQITAIGSLEVSGTISAGGAGGDGGAAAMVDAASGAGGGSGGAILLEAPLVTITSTAILAANGGGGGSSGADMSIANPGAGGTLSSTPAPGGAATVAGTVAGGAGGAARIAAVAGVANTANAGGGGGGVGKIVVRGRVRTLGAAIISPPPIQDDVK